MTTRGLGLLESFVGSESGHHVGMCGNEDPQTDPWENPWELQSGIYVYEGDGCHPRHSFLAERAPDDRTEVSVPPVLRFAFRRKRQPLLQSPPPYPIVAQPARSVLSVAQLAATLFFAPFREYYRERIWKD